jgi:transcriptional regulator with XRE-family HTH domain
MPKLTNLKRVRQEKPVTLRELERERGVAQSTISALENLQRQAQPRTVRKLAEALKVEPRELM